MTILLIALIPAVVVFFIAVGTESKVKTAIAALIAAAMGILTGNPAYMVLDVVAVGLAYWLAMTMVWDVSKPVRPPKVAAVPAPSPVVNKPDSGSLSTVLVMAVLGYFAYLYLSTGSSHKPLIQQPPPAMSQPPVAVQRPVIAPQSASPPALPEPVKKRAKRPVKSALQRCLEIKSEDKMTTCLERLG